MKAKPNPRFLPSLLLGLALATGPATAQEPPDGLSPIPTTTEQLVLIPGAVVIPQADFQDATLGEVVDFLVAKSGANLMISSEVKQLKVPDMTLRNVTGLGVLRAIASTGVPFQVTETAPEIPGDTSVWVIVGTNPVDRDLPNITQIFNLRNVQPIGAVAAAAVESPVSRDEFTAIVQEMNSAVLTALKARSESINAKVDLPVIKVHESTRLLIISGHPEEVNIAQQVVCALGGQPVN
ncbi:hypothetical protein [Luteolibacter sp. Populi]|uniref:hypothetical protein n=1 Tax=Luteolibacter sp. Populi TaxID=3230487 RepID=UPI0034669D1C